MFRLATAAGASLGAAALAHWQLRSGSERAPRLERWQGRWDDSITSWHLDELNPVLEKHLPAIAPLPRAGVPRARVLFPLCGASVDLSQLALRGYEVVGIEAIGLALERLRREFEEQQPAPGLLKGLMRGVQADFIELDAQTRAELGKFDASFDRGALVAVTPEDRPKYAETLTSLMATGGKVLLVAVEHEPAFGPPYSVDGSEVRRLFGRDFEVRELSREDKFALEPRWKERGATRFEEVTYVLTKRG